MLSVVSVGAANVHTVDVVTAQSIVVDEWTKISDTNIHTLIQSSRSSEVTNGFVIQRIGINANGRRVPTELLRIMLLMITG